MTDTLKVLIDISILGLGMLHPEMRGGGFRVDERMVDELRASEQCELSFCANHSSVIHDGAAQYLRSRPALAGYSLLGAQASVFSNRTRRMLMSLYRRSRAVFPHGSLPSVLRASGQLLDRGVHRPVTDTPSGVDIFHSTHFALPKRERAGGPQRFLTIYDLRTRAFPELYDARSREYAEEILSSVDRRDWILTTSEASRTELLETGRFEPEQIFVVPLAADRERFRPIADVEMLRSVRQRYGIGDGPYVLCVSSIDIRKNMRRTIHAFTQLLRQQSLRDLRLVIAGAAGSGSTQMMEALNEASEVRQNIVQTGFVRDEDLAALYSGATVFLYPSLYEGFGLPPLEAMQCGTPVITSNGSSLPEVVGDAGVMVDPEDVDAMSAAIFEVVTRTEWRQQLAQRSLERAAQFSWKKTGEILLASYRTALAAGSARSS